MKNVLVPLAQGCEELEAITVIDLLTRAGLDVVTAGLDEEVVIAARGTKIVPKVNIEKVKGELFDMVVLPGGLPGADHLRDNKNVQEILKNHEKNKKYLAAICAAPKALAEAGVLNGKVFTCYPGALDGIEVDGATKKTSALEIDGKVITSRGPGTAMDFSLALIELLEGKSKKIEVEKGLAR